MSPKPIHEWEPTGVTGYPITHPIVGQTDFFCKFKHWLPLVGGDRFAHVFAAVAPWGVGKSRLGYEIIAQVNGASRGWKVRSEDGTLTNGELFDSDAERDQYLALYIRYSQVAHRQLNLDNWFAPAVYKALAPLARGRFDTSIQHQIARQALNRLEAEGFDPSHLAAAMELDQHPEEAIYADTALATRLCNAAFDVLKDYGIRYVIVVLDELETAAERATAGMEAEDARAMDGRSITMLRKAVELLGREDIEMMSKAVKEEDARARFPWLRLLALCSPAIGDELKEVQSTDRRFEIVDLERNAFSDISSFVKSLEEDDRLLRPYPPGLVEAAYMISGANFGWFNVVMAVVDQVLRPVSRKETPTLSDVFRRAIDIQERIGRYVLDWRALDEINLAGDARESASLLLFGQQPVPVANIGEDTAKTLLAARNAHGEPIATRYHRVTWRKQDCMQVLAHSRFQRQSGTAKYVAPGITEAIDLERLLDDLATLAVHESKSGAAEGEYRLLLPGTLPDFLHLIDLVHPHAAVEETGRTLWMALVGTSELAAEQATYLGPSVEMLRRLDIRLRKASVGSVLRDPDENEALTRVQDRVRPSERERALQLLTGALRLLDQNWSYDAEPAGLGDPVIAIRTPRTGLIDFKGLWLHPKGHAVFAGVTGDDNLRALAEAVARNHRVQGRYPVLAFTTDYGLAERFEKSSLPVFHKARQSIVVVHINSSEESALQSIGLPTAECEGFRLRWDGFTTRFAERLNRIRAPINKRVREWRQQVSRRGGIAWPIRPNGVLKEESLRCLVDGWRVVMLEHGGRSLDDVGPAKGLDHAGVLQEIEKLVLSPAAAPKGYGSEDTAHLWVGQGPEARPDVPPFFLHSIVPRLRSELTLTPDAVRSDWFWGYTWDGNRPSDIFREWMAVAVDLGWAIYEAPEKKKGQYRLLPRKQLRGELDAARKWLEDDYPRIIERLSDLLGPGLIDQWFKPGSGAKYQTAEQKLNRARQMLEQLDALEANSPRDDDADAARDWFVEATRLRLSIRSLVREVFDKKEYEQLQPNLDSQTLYLTDEDRPLWERIRQAEHFADAVKRIATRIRKRIRSLGDEMRTRVSEIPSFPINLFTRPLSKIDHIVDAGLTGEDPTSTTERAQHAQPDTLAHYLKDLRVADAMEAIRALAREVGVSEHPSEDQPIEQIDGEILSGFFELVERYGNARSALADLTGRVVDLEDALKDAPSDFAPPVGASLDDIRDRPMLIEGELDQSLEDDVEDLLERHNAEMNLGRFGPVMREARTRLLDIPERSVKGLEGKVRTLENAVAAYRQQLLRDGVLHRYREPINILRGIRGLGEVRMPELADLATRSLEDGRIYIDGLAAGWLRDGESLLSGTGVGFGDWVATVERVKQQKDPVLSPERVEALVSAGLLRRVYALGGPS